MVSGLMSDHEWSFRAAFRCSLRPKENGGQDWINVTYRPVMLKSKWIIGGLPTKLKGLARKKPVRFRALCNYSRFLYYIFRRFYVPGFYNFKENREGMKHTRRRLVVKKAHHQFLGSLISRRFGQLVFMELSWHCEEGL